MNLQIAAFTSDPVVRRLDRCVPRRCEVSKHRAAGARHSSLKSQGLKQRERLRHLGAQSLCNGLQVVMAKAVRVCSKV